MLKVESSAIRPHHFDSQDRRNSTSLLSRFFKRYCYFGSMRNPFTKKSRLGMGTIRQVGCSSYDYMLEKGSVWKENRIVSIDQLSSTNLSRIKQELGELSQEQSLFLDRILTSEFFVTHATDCVDERDGTISIFSRKYLKEHDLLVKDQNTAYGDIFLLASDDFVHFNLECGSTPKKLESRFGSQIIRSNFSQAVFANSAWMSLSDMGYKRYLTNNRFSEYISLQSFQNIEKLRSGTTVSVFKGGDILPGLGYSLLRDMKKCLTAEECHKIYQIKDADILDICINTFYRPEVRVPRQFSTQEVTIVPVKKIYEFLEL